MSKRKILSLALTLCMVAILAVGGSLAYFMDSDIATNVMSLGGVEIKQYEKDKNGNPFTQDQPLLPRVDTIEITKENIKGEDGFYNEAIKNVVDKVITVKNEAPKGAENKDAFVRTIIAFETNDVYEADTNTIIGDAHDMYFGINTTGLTFVMDGEEFATITIGDEKYVLAYKVYEDALAPQEESEPSLKQIFMAPTAGNEISDLFGNQYTILALSQGVQTAGFEEKGAAVALDTAFGEINAENCYTWFTTTVAKP